jgi:hypothetical protein
MQTSTTLLLGLEHQEASVRALAVTQLRDALSDAVMTSADKEYLSTTLIHRLRDDDATVVRGALSLGPALANLVTPAAFIDAAALAFAGRCTPKVAAGFCTHMATHILGADAIDAGAANGADSGRDVSWRITSIILPRLIGSTKPKVARALVDALADLPSEHAPPLLRSMKKLAKQSAWSALEKGASEEVIAAANQALFEHLSKNLIGKRAGASLEAEIGALSEHCCRAESSALQHIGMTVLCEALVGASDRAVNALLVEHLSLVLTAMLPSILFPTSTIFSVPKKACTFTRDTRLEKTFTTIYEVFPSICLGNLSSAGTVKQ